MHSEVHLPAGRLVLCLTHLLWLWLAPAVAAAQSATTLSRPASLPASATAPASQPSALLESTPGQVLSLEIRPAPTDDEGIQERLALVESKLAELVRSSASASAPASQPADQANRSPAQRLHDALFLYRSELLRWQAVRKQLGELQRTEAVEEFSKALADWKEKRQFYERLHGEGLRNATQEHTEAVHREYRESEARLSDLSSEQSAVEQQRGSLNKQKEQAEQEASASLDQLKKYLAALPARLNDAKTAQDREDLFLHKRALEWTHSLQLLCTAASADFRAALELQQQQNAARITALAGYVRALREYRNRLEKARSQSEAEYAAEQLARPDLPPWKVTFWEAVLHAAEGLRYFQELDDPTRNRFPPSESEQLEQRLMRSRAYWEDFMESIDRRPGSVISAAYRRIDGIIAAEQEELKSLEEKLDQTVDEQRAAMDRQNLLMSRAYALHRQFDQQVEHLQEEALVEARKHQARLTGEVRAGLTGKIQAIISEQQATRERLKKSVAALQEHIDLLSRYRSAMYWSRLLVGGSSLLDQDWKAVFGTLQEAARGEGLVGDVWKRHWHDVGSEFRAISGRRMATGTVLVLVALALGLVSRRRLLRRARGLEEEWLPIPERRAADFRLPLPRRFRIEVTGAAGRVAPVVLPLFAALAFAAYVFGLTSGAFSLISVVLLSLIGARVALAWIHANFAPGRPDTRLIPCSEAVADYHQGWLRLLVLLALLLLPAPVFFGRAGLLPEVTSVLLALALTALLLAAFVYVLRRGRFLGQGRAAGEGKSPWHTVLWTVLPVLPAGVLVLIGLAVSGYEALALYVVAGTVWSMCVTWTAVVLWELLHLVSSEGKRQLDEALAASESADIELDPDKTHPLLLIGLQLASLGVVVLGAVVLLYGWGISPFEIQLLLNYPLGTLGGGPVHLWRPFAAVAAIAGAFMISRTVRAFLQTKVFPQASNLSRGGQAAVLTILNYSFIALGGYAALALMNLRLGALAVLVGTLGLGLGLGLQPLFVNFISGLLILFERQINVGDTVVVQDQLGEVTAITTRSTKIRTPDNIELDIPNAEFVTSKVVNWSLPDRRIRGQVDVGVGYDSDDRLVYNLLLDIARRSPLVLSDPPPEVWFADFGERALKFTLVCWFPNPGIRWKFMMSVRFEIREVFRKHGIGIPFPQRTISVLGDRPIPVQVVQNGQHDGYSGRAAAGEADEKPDGSPHRA